MNKYILKLVTVFFILGINTFKSYSNQAFIDDNDSIKRDFEVTTTDVGSIPSSYSNSPSGGLVYTIPIDIYPGRDNFQPSINLTYNSQTQREGVAGLGWNIGGLSSIQRTNANQYYNKAVGSAGFYFEDFFLYNLDGLRLLIEPGETFVTEQGNIKLDYTKEGNAFFKAFYPNGNIAYFGINEGQGRDKTISFPITKIEDTKGNYIKYIYTKSDNIYYIREIQYGVKSQTNPLAFVSFIYDTKNVSTPLYFDGEEILQKKLLSDINIYYQSKLLKSYKLTYEKGAVNYFTQLDLLTGDYLFERFEPLRFTYDYTDKLDVTVKTDTLKNYKMQPSDKFAGGRVNAFSLKTEISEPHRGLVIYPMKSSYDVREYGQAESNYSISDTAYIYKDIRNNDELPLKLPLQIQNPKYTFIDFRELLNVDVNGDGIEKLVRISSSLLYPVGQAIIFDIFNSDLSESLQFEIDTKEELFAYESPSDYQRNARNKTFLKGDFRGIGKEEILIIIHCDDFIDKDHNYGSRAILVSLSEQKIIFDLSFSDVKGKDMLMTVDFDSDGKTDLVHVNNDGLSIYNYSRLGGDSFNLVASTDAVNCDDLYIPPRSTRPNFSDYNDKNTMAFGDINGDGYLDILISPDHYTCKGHQCASIDLYPDFAKEWTILYAKGKNKNFVKQTFILDLAMELGQQLFFQDVKGNGFPYLFALRNGDVEVFENKNGILNRNVIYENKGNLGNQIIFSDIYNIKEPLFIVGFNNYHHTIQDYSLSVVSNLMATSTNSLGVETKYYYGNLLDGNTHQVTGNQLAFPYNKFVANVNILSDITSSYQGKEIESKKYRYENAILHRQGLGFRGFEKVSLTNNIVDKTITQVYDPTEQSTLKEEISDVGKVTYEYDIDIQPNKKTKVLLKTKIEEDYLNNTTVSSIFGYDTYGNLTNSKTDYGDGLVETSVSKLKNIDNGKTYLLGQVEEQSGTKTRNKESVTTKSVLTYYDNFLPDTKTNYYNDNKVSEQKFVYDDALNLKESKQRAYKSANWLTTSYEYDTYGRLIKETDPLGLYDINIFNAKGLLESVTNHKGNTTQYKYDNWGRNIEIIYADGVTESTEYKWSIDKPKGAVYAVTKKSSVDPETTTYYDYLGREIRSGQKRFDGSYLYTDQVYDKKGQVSKVSLPFKGSEATLWNTYLYDKYNRPTSVNYASGKKDSFSYAPLKTTSVINGIKTTKTVDASGAIVEIEDPAGIIVYDLRADGQPKTVTAPGDVETSFEYDEYGRQTAIIDPSAGRKQFVYDDQGNTYQEIDARGKVTQMLYDKYNRLKTKEVVDEQTSSYNYNADGLLETITNTNGSSKSFEYDALLRPKANKESIMDSKWLQKDYVYENGNLKSVAYTSQSGYLTSENYAYNNGHLSEIKIDGDRSIWKLTAENSLGMPTASTTGRYNRSYGYTQFGIPTSRIIKNGDKTVQNFDYQFDPATGNLIGRKDNTQNLKEGFGYDELNRLTRFGDKTMGYDVKGNITHKKSVGVFDYSSSKPYAIDLISTGEGEDQVLERNQDITYNAMMRPSSISEGGKTTNFFYDADASRIKMQTKQGDVEELTRYYIGSQYEYDITLEGTEERLFLDGDAYGAPAVFVKKNQKEYLYYLGRDYLGSITHVLDADGNLLQELSYDAWGRLRKPENHELYAQGSEIEPILGGRGYTGHEHLMHYGLINMNARLYDPVVGRFLSPDPYIQAPDFSQNFNRYSYALNNPLIYTDPNGEFLLPAILVGAIVGGTVNLAYKAMTGQIHSFTDGAMAFGIGAVAGGIGAATGGAAFLAAGGGAAGAGGFLAGAAAGVFGYMGAAPIENIGNHLYFGDPLMSTGDYAKGLVLSGITGGGLQAISAFSNGKNIWNGQSVADGRTQFSFKNTPVKPKYNPSEIRNEIKILNAPEANIPVNKSINEQYLPNIQQNKWESSVVSLAQETFDQSYLFPKQFERYTVYSTNGLVGDSYNVNIFYLEASGNSNLGGMRSLLNTFENQAINSGANKISIYGSTVINNRLLNPTVINRLGYSYEKIGSSIILQKPLK